ncbi:MAG: hypothetical protein WBH74_01000 [Methanothermobacter thermautotrophicus]|nr:hypothetical protein [Methanothermobacter sp. CaT2]MDI6817900.1 hypothetical protein [Methanothermobacter thermautotrophicus]
MSCGHNQGNTPLRYWIQGNCNLKARSACPKLRFDVMGHFDTFMGQPV